MVENFRTLVILLIRKIQRAAKIFFLLLMVIEKGWTLDSIPPADKPTIAKTSATTPLSEADSQPSSSIQEPLFDDKAMGDWNNLRPFLQKKGIALGLEVVPEYFYNFLGGIRSGSRGAATVDLNLTIDTEKAMEWQGGTFYIDLEDHAGQNPSRVLTGDLQFFDPYNFTPFFEIFELWYQQTLCNERWRFKWGKVDANTEFSVIENGLPFLNSTAQITPTILSFPTTPDPTLGINVFYKPSKFFYASFGIFDANRKDRFGIFYGHPENYMLTRSGILLIGEAAAIWENAFFKKEGNFKLGVWRHTGTFRGLGGNFQKGAAGYYIILNQTLWEPHKKSQNKLKEGVRTFLAYGNTNSNIGLINASWSGGVTWTGFLETRQEDILGFSANYVHIRPAAQLRYSYELALEWLYRIQLFPWMMIGQDLQYIIHPGGTYSNALVETLRLNIKF